jgi:hypothetical protein
MTAIANTNYGCINRDHAIIVRGTVAASQTLTAGDGVVTDSSGNWIISPTNTDGTRKVAVICSDVTTASGETQSDVEICLWGWVNVVFDAAVEIGQRMKPSDATAGQFEVAVNTDDILVCGVALTAGGTNGQGTMFIGMV